ncbi:MAG: hypothetical protein KAU48_09650, partial [Candidatus Thorarchaeota archaeon]|nr:hypothetical protein [Candidatus Thorarchaeota archaeon]
MPFMFLLDVLGYVSANDILRPVVKGFEAITPFRMCGQSFLGKPFFRSITQFTLKRLVTLEWPCSSQLPAVQFGQLYPSWILAIHSVAHYAISRLCVISN